MKMKFYDALQMAPAILKRKIAACDTRQDKVYYWAAIAIRSVLIVVFAIVIHKFAVRCVWRRQYPAGSSIVLYSAGNPLCQF